LFNRNYNWREKGYFKIEDIELCTNEFCKYRITEHIELDEPGRTGCDYSLCGEYLNQMIELNNFILTSACTNYHLNTSKTGYCKFLCFFTTPNLAKLIFEHFSNLEDYDVLYVNFLELNHCYVHTSPNFTEFVSSQYPNNFKYGILPDYPGDFGSLNYLLYDLVYFEIIDSKPGRKNLFETLLCVLKSLQK
jgi:hypothetical protein